MQSCCRALGKAPPCSGSSSPTRLPGTTASTRASRAPSNLSPTPRHLGPHPLRLPTTATRYKPDQQPAEPQAKQAATTDNSSSSTTTTTTTTLSSPTASAAAAIGAGAAAASEGAAASSSAGAGAVQSASVQLSAEDVMEDMCTMLGGITSKHFTGYAGQWRTWEVLPKQQQQQQHEDQQPHTDPTPGAVPTITSISDTTISSTTHPTSPSPSDTTNPPGSDSTTPTGSPTSSSPTSSSSPTAAEPPAAFSSSGGQHTIRLIDDGINVRLWRLQQQQQQSGSIGLQKAEAVGPTTGAVVPPAAAAAAAAAAGVIGSTDSVGGCTVQQANFYHHPTKMAGPSTRFAQYLTGNTMSGRPDGYGLRVWGFNTGSDMINPDASSWLDGSGTPAECSMRVLTVPGQATTIINGALPSGFGPGHTPQFWVLEFIAKEPGSDVCRWSSMNWYDRGELVVNRSINEDRVQLAGEPDDIRIHPQDISFSNRREGLLPLDIDAWATQHTQAAQGTATVFSFASVPGGPQGAQALTLTRTSGLPCSWSNPFDSLALTAPAAATTQPGGAGSTGVGNSSSSSSSQGQAGVAQQQALQQRQSECPPVDVVVQSYPDWSYCRVPRSIREVVEGGHSTAVFEAGTVLRSGALVRWLLEYDTAGRRLIKSARFEAYPPAA